MKKLILTIFLIFGLTQFNLGQSSTRNNNNFSRSFVISLGFGLTAATTDYQTIKLGSLFNGSFEYNFPSTSNVTFGIRVFGATGIFNGKDGFGVNNEFKTPFHYIGAGPQVTFRLSPKVYTTLSAGISSLWFYPKDIRDNNLPNFAANVYDNQTMATNIDLNLRFMTSDKMSLNIFGSVFAGNGTNNDYFDDLNSGDAIDIVFSTGVSLSYYFGGEKDTDGDGVIDSKDICKNTPKGVKVDDFGCALDSDGDGVADYLDKSPGTPKGVKVDKNGVPLDTDGDGVADYLDKSPGTPKGVKVDKNGVPLDTDEDGVADYLDKSPGTPKGVKVDKNGVPLDTDGDGVADYLDKCPETPTVDKVDQYGCSVIPPIVFGADANFGFNSSKLLRKSAAKLDNLAEKMNENKQYIAIVEGYTDAVGSAKYNLILSKRRAESVVNYLVRKGVDRNRFKIQAFGEANPTAPNNTKQGRAKNRRVVIKLMQRN